MQVQHEAKMYIKMHSQCLETLMTNSDWFWWLNDSCIYYVRRLECIIIYVGLNDTIFGYCRPLPKKN